MNLKVESRPVVIAVPTQLIDEKLGRVEHARGLDEEAPSQCARFVQIGLMQRTRRLLDQKVAAERRRLKSFDDLLGEGAEAHGLVHLAAGGFECRRSERRAHGVREELELPGLRRGDETGPEDGPATKVQLRDFVNVLLVAEAAVLPEVPAAEAPGNAAVVEV